MTELRRAGMSRGGGRTGIDGDGDSDGDLNHRCAGIIVGASGAGWMKDDGVEARLIDDEEK